MIPMMSDYRLELQLGEQMLSLTKTEKEQLKAFGFFDEPKNRFKF
jgi:hypothetical protein